MIQTILEALKNPDPRYRSIPFWSWNGRLDAGELRRQVRDMARAGFGGYFIHARSGLRTGYFSREWMECIEACADEGRRNGLSTWLYDENGYPSGFAGGAVPAKGIAYQQKHLVFERKQAEALCPGETTLALYRMRGERFERTDAAALSAGDTALHIYYRVNPYYSDLLDARVVRAFLDSTYEPYFERLGSLFGKEIPGIFTDEPQYGRSGIPWSFALPGAFRERCGYDILDCLPALDEKVPEYEKYRYDFWSTVTALFTENYAAQTARWCREHGCRMTGHVLLEENTRLQTLCSGSAMGFYRHMDIPGIDWLGRGLGDPVIVKQVASAAAQTGRELVLSEMFAAAGWNAVPARLMRIAQWQYALGVNLTCSHLYAYSLTGVRKKDHPPALSYQSNWHEQLRILNDTLARLGMLLSRGEPGQCLLVIHPLRSGWIALDAACTQKKGNSDTDAMDGRFAALSRRLSELHLEYHYGDEGMLAELGRVEDGALWVGRCRYKAALVPAATTLDAVTVELLEGLAAAGGTVFAFRDFFPALLGGRPSGRLEALRARCVLLRADLSDLPSLRERTACGAVDIADQYGRQTGAVYHRVGYYPGGAALLLVNMEDRDTEALVSVRGYGHASRIDPESCTASPLPVGDGGKVRLQFEPGRFQVLYWSREAEAGMPCAPGGGREVMELKKEWNIASATPNVLLLDTCRLSVEGGAWSGPMPLVDVQKRMLELGRTAEIAMAFSVDCRADLGAAPLELVTEERSHYAIEVNGKPVEGACGWWKDISFARVDLSGRIRPGINTVVLRTTFRNSPEQVARLARAKEFEAEMNMLTLDSEVDNIYLLGDFSVRTDGIVEKDGPDSLRAFGPFYLAPPRTGTVSELTASGFPFFTGTVLLEQRVELSGRYESCLLKMDRPRCACCRVHVNGQPVRMMLWPPYEAEIGPYLREGVNVIGLELISADRNLFGPHHHPGGEITDVGPFSFTGAAGWNDGYSLVLLGPGDTIRMEYIKE